MYKYTDSGLKGIVLKNGYEVYQTEFGQGVSIHDLEGLHNAIGMDMICNKPALDGSEIRFLRKELDLAQTTLAHILGVSESTVRSWENSRAKIAAPADRLLRNLYREHVCGEGKVRELLDRLAQLNRESYHEIIELEETETGWARAA